MKIIIAANIGFCFGARRAILIAEKSLREDLKPIQFLGSLIHNEMVIEGFKNKGVKFVKTLKTAGPGTLIIQAHGFPPFPKKVAGNMPLIKDATCPLVKKAQLLANSLYKKGYGVIIVGDKRHSETKGIKGYAENSAVIIENENQAKKLPQFNKIGIVSQTTQNLDKFNRIVKILKKRVKKMKYFNTICPEVRNRQKELKVILKKSDRVLVIGSRTSVNTRRLVEICKKYKKPVWWISSLEELKKKDLKDCVTLGVVSGTSVPDWEIKKIKKWLKDVKQK